MCTTFWRQTGGTCPPSLNLNRGTRRRGRFFRPRGAGRIAPIREKENGDEIRGGEISIIGLRKDCMQMNVVLPPERIDSPRRAAAYAIVRGARAVGHDRGRPSAAERGRARREAGGLASGVGCVRSARARYVESDRCSKKSNFSRARGRGFARPGVRVPRVVVRQPGRRSLVRGSRRQTPRDVESSRSPARAGFVPSSLRAGENLTSKGDCEEKGIVSTSFER